ncbi:hypothetical protein GH733_003252 [Mirounga leonina]|nr:hypothetical protein GH733_003252 [Mirounga leonina]
MCWKIEARKNPWFGSGKFSLWICLAAAASTKQHTDCKLYQEALWTWRSGGCPSCAQQRAPSRSPTPALALSLAVEKGERNHLL